MAELNEKQRAFADYYLMNNNAGESYRLAYDPTGDRKLTQGSCYTQGSRLLQNVKVSEYLNVRRAELQSERVLTTQQILEEITQLATDRGVKPADRLKALELLGKSQALFTDKLRHEGELGIEIVLDGFDDEQ